MSIDWRRRVGMLCAVAAACLFTAFAVQRPYHGVFFQSDDFHHLSRIALVASGEIRLTDYLLTPHNEHFVPLWKSMYYWHWRLFGCDPGPWHITVTVCHGLSSVCLFLLIRRFTENTVAGAVSGLLWAGAAIGGWDNPLIWIAASHLTIGVMWILASMLCLSLRCQTGHPAWTIAMLTTMCLSVLTMGTMLMLCLVLPAQYRLIERERTKPRLGWHYWLSLWLPAVLLLGLLQAAVVAPGMIDSDSPPMSLVTGLRMTGAGYVQAFLNLFLPIQQPPLWLTGGLLTAVMYAAVAVPRVRGVCITVLVLTLIHSLVAYEARSGWAWEQVMTWGRFRYLATLFWAALGGLLTKLAIEAATRMRPSGDDRPRPMPIIVAIVCLLTTGASISQQVRLANRSTEEFVRGNAATKRRFEAVRSRLSDLSAEAVREQRIATVPDEGVKFFEEPHRVSQVAVYAFPEGLPNVEFTQERNR